MNFRKNVTDSLFGGHNLLQDKSVMYQLSNFSKKLDLQQQEHLAQFGAAAGSQSYQIVSPEVAKKVPKNAKIRILAEE